MPDLHLETILILTIGLAVSPRRKFSLRSSHTPPNGSPARLHHQALMHSANPSIADLKASLAANIPRTISRSNSVSSISGEAVHSNGIASESVSRRGSRATPEQLALLGIKPHGTSRTSIKSSK